MRYSNYCGTLTEREKSVHHGVRREIKKIIEHKIGDKSKELRRVTVLVAVRG